MTNIDVELEAAYDAVDRERTNAAGGIDLIVGLAKELLADFDPATAWSLLSVRLVHKMGCETNPHKYMAGMLAEVAITRALAELGRTET
jgi:hypothetical protein